MKRGDRQTYPGYGGQNYYAYGPPPEKQRVRERVGLPGWSILLLVPLIILFSLFIMIVFVGRPYIVRGISMQPTLHEGDRVFVVKYRFGKTPERGDVIVLKEITSDGEMLIKRVVAVAGDTVTTENGSVMVDGKYYHKNTGIEVDEPLTLVVPKGDLFVMGDNEARSYDSRIFGPVSLNKVVGRAVLIFWPPGDFQKL